MALDRTVVRRFPKGRDVETHVSLVKVGDDELVEFADFVVSRGEYGRGYHFPRSGAIDAQIALKELP